MFSLCLRRFSPGKQCPPMPLTTGKSYSTSLKADPEPVIVYKKEAKRGNFFWFDSEIRNKTQELKEIYCAGSAQTHNKTIAQPLFLVLDTDGAQKDPLSL